MGLVQVSLLSYPLLKAYDVCLGDLALHVHCHVFP